MLVMFYFLICVVCTCRCFQFCFPKTYTWFLHFSTYFTTIQKNFFKEVCFKNLVTGTAGEQVAMRMRCKLYSGSCLRGSPPLPSPLASISGYVQVEGEGAVWSSWRPLLVTLAMSGALIMVVEKVITRIFVA